MKQRSDAIRAANFWLETATLQELKEFVFDRLVDELEEDAIFRNQLLRQQADQFEYGDSGDEQPNGASNE